MPSNSSSRLKTMSGFQSMMARRSSDKLSAKPKRQDLMPGRLQMRDDVVFGAPFVDLLLGRAHQGIGRHQGGVHQHQNSQFLHSATRGNCRSS